MLTAYHIGGEDDKPRRNSNSLVEGKKFVYPDNKTNINHQYVGEYHE